MEENCGQNSQAHMKVVCKLKRTEYSRVPVRPYVLLYTTVSNANWKHDQNITIHQPYDLDKLMSNVYIEWLITKIGYDKDT